VSAKKYNASLRDFGLFIVRKVTSMTKALPIKCNTENILRIHEIKSIELYNETYSCNTLKVA